MQSHATSAARRPAQPATPTATQTDKELAAACTRSLKHVTFGGAIYSSASHFPGYFFDRTTDNIATNLQRAAQALRKPDPTRPTIARELEFQSKLFKPDTFFFQTLVGHDPANARILTALGNRYDTVIAALRKGA